MGVRRRVGAGGACARLCWGALGLLAAAALVAAVPLAEARSRQAVRPLDFHATVLNDRILGSAFQIEDGLAITNAHVVRGLAAGDPVELTASTRGQVRAQGRLVATSARMDLAVLAVPRGFLATVAARDARGIAGQAVVAAGMDATGSFGPGPALELEGHILAPRADLPAFGPGLVAWLPGVRPGFSGGPLLDADGALVGMITAIRSAQPATAPVALSGVESSPGSSAIKEEAFVLRASEIRAEVRRLLRSAR